MFDDENRTSILKLLSNWAQIIIIIIIGIASLVLLFPW